MQNQATAERKENKLGTMPVGKLLVNISLPIIISMLVMAFYNIIDSIYVSHYNSSALAALTYAMPIQNLIIAFGTGTGVGVNSYVSRCLGEKKYNEARKAAANGLFLTLCTYIVFALFGFFFVEAYIKSQTSSPETIKQGVDYLRICLIFSFGAFFEIMAERLLQSTGKSLFTMCTQSIGAIINIVLDPILIFGYISIPALNIHIDFLDKGMGVSGAAIATVVGQIVAAIIALLLNHFKNKDIRVKIKEFMPDWQIIKTIYIVGLPTIVMQSIGSVMTYGMNKILAMNSEAAVNVFGAYFKLRSFVFMPVFGLNTGIIPIIAYNYGAKKKERIIKAMRLSTISAMTMMFIGVLVFVCFPAQLLGFFKPDETMLRLGIPALRIISISFVFAGYCITIGSMFQALGNGVYSLINSATRQLVFLLPLAFIIFKLFGVNYVWWSIVLAEVVSVAMTNYFLMKIIRQKIKPMNDKEVVA